MLYASTCVVPEPLLYRVRFQLVIGVSLDDGVSAGVALQRLVGGDVPAAAAGVGRGVDDDEAVLVGQRPEVGAGVQVGPRALTAVQRQQDRGVGLDVVRHVQIHRQAGRVGA